MLERMDLEECVLVRFKKFFYFFFYFENLSKTCNVSYTDDCLGF